MELQNLKEVSNLMQVQKTPHFFVLKVDICVIHSYIDSSGHVDYALKELKCCYRSFRFVFCIFTTDAFLCVPFLDET